MSFQEMKQKRAQAIANLVKAAESTSEKKSYGDDRMWAPTVDKAGNEGTSSNAFNICAVA